MLEIECPNFGPLVFFGERFHSGHDFMLASNCHGHAAQVLIFLDSRGISRQYSGSLAQRLVEHFVARGVRYLMVVRPLELTTWATLSSFLARNRIAPCQLITNMGFVDFTPKKKSVLDDALGQLRAAVGPSVATAEFVTHYESSTGEPLPLYAMRYASEFAQHVENLVARWPTMVINTPQVKPNIRIERARPPCFFEALSHACAFNDAIPGARVPVLPTLDERHTYDAVHYTDEGNRLLFQIIEEHL